MVYAVQDFGSNFQRLEICHLGPDSLEADQCAGKTKRRYEQIVINGSWIRRVSAGGCRNVSAFSYSYSCSCSCIPA